MSSVYSMYPSASRSDLRQKFLGRYYRLTRSDHSSPLHSYGYKSSNIMMHHNSIPAMGSPYYRDMDEPTSPSGGGHHRSRSASRPPISHSMDYPRKKF